MSRLPDIRRLFAETLGALGRVDILVRERRRLDPRPYPPDVNCNEIPDRNFRVVGTDVHRFDVDHDGIACEE
jgi:micrococcal nuclease